MSPTLTLRHYIEAPLAHSHDHAQLVFGLSGQLDLAVDGRGSQVNDPLIVQQGAVAHCDVLCRKSPALKIASRTTDARPHYPLDCDSFTPPVQGSQ